jgi:hypothetical protein
MSDEPGPPVGMQRTDAPGTSLAERTRRLQLHAVGGTQSTGLASRANSLSCGQDWQTGACHHEGSAKRSQGCLIGGFSRGSDLLRRCA